MNELECNKRIAEFLYNNRQFESGISELGHAFIAGGRIEIARNCFAIACELNDNNVGAKLDLAYCMRELGEIGQSKEILFAALAKQPDNMLTLTSLFITCQRDGDAAALDFFSRIDRSQAIAHGFGVQCVNCLRALGKSIDAQVWLSDLLQAYPDDFFVNLTIAEVSLENEDYDTAKWSAKKAMALSPQADHPFFLLVHGLINSGQHQAALTEIASAEKIRGRNAQFSALRLHILASQGRVDEAFALLLENELSVSSSYALSWHAANLALQIGDIDRTAKYLEIAPCTSPDECGELLVLKGRLDAARGDNRSALSNFRAAQDVGLRRNISIEIAQLGLSSLNMPLVDETLGVHLPMPAQRAALAHCHAVAAAYKRDYTMIACLEDIAGQPTEHQALALATIVKENVESVPAAVRLIATLIDNRAIQSDLGNLTLGEFDRIPRRIVQYWENDVPEDVSVLMARWSKMNAGYKYELSDREKARAFLATHTCEDTVRAFDAAPQASRRANIFRFAYLAVNGGVYTDADERCLVPLENWLPHTASFVGNRKDFGLLNCNFMAVEAGSRIMKIALEGATRAILEQGPDPLWMTNGPGRLTTSLALHAAQKTDDCNDNILILTCNKDQVFVSTDFSLSYKKTADHWWVDEYGSA